MATPNERITLNELDFSDLIRGGVVIKSGRAIMLVDIELERMVLIIAKAQVEAWKVEQEDWRKRKPREGKP